MKPQFKTLKLGLLIKGILLLTTATTFAQFPGVEWEETIGGNSDDYAESIAQTSDGGYIIGGYSRSDISGDKTENNLGPDYSSDYWIMKTDANGNIEWQNTIGGDSYEYLTSIEETMDGGFIIGGYSNSGVSGDKTENDAENDYWIIKLDNTGNIIWQNTIKGTEDERSPIVRQMADGNYIVAGTSESGAGIDKTEINYGYEDIWILKIDASGNIVWQNTIGGNHYDVLKGMDLTVDGGIILGADSRSDISGDKTENAFGTKNYYDYWVVKLNALGNIEWQKTIGGFKSDFMNSISQTTDNGFIIGGTSESGATGLKTEPGISNDYDYWIIKLDATGNILWQNTIGGDHNEYDAVAIEVEDGFMVGGTSWSGISGDKAEDEIGGLSGLSDYWILKLDMSGNIVWQKTLGADDAESFAGMIQVADGGYLIAGISDSYASGFKSEGFIGDNEYDYWIVKTLPETCSIPTGVFSNNITPTKATAHWDNIPGADSYQIWCRAIGAALWIKKSATTNLKTLKSLTPETAYEYKVRSKCTDGEWTEFSPIEYFTTLPLKAGEVNDELIVDVYPNPASNILHISIENAENATIEIFDMTGNRLESFPASDDDDLTSIDIAHLPKGIYFLHVSGVSGTQVMKFIRQ